MRCSIEGQAMIADICIALREFMKWAMEGGVGKSLGEQKRIPHSGPLHER